MRTSLAAAASSLLALSSLGSLAGEAGTGSRTERREVPPFDSIEISSGIRATVALGPQAPLELEGDKDSLGRVETRVENGLLRVGFRRHFGFSLNHDVEVKIVVPVLRAAEASGGARIKAALARVDTLRLDASGGGELRISGIDAGTLAASGSGGARLALQGTADHVTLELSGGTRVDSSRLAAKAMRVSASGGCDGRVRVAQALRGDLSGGSSLRVIGNPSVRVSTSGGSSVESEP